MPKLLVTDQRLRWPEGKGPNWKHTPDGFDGGRFGRIEHAVVCKPDGTAIFDRLVTVEGGHVITVTFGLDSRDYGYKLGLVKEARDTAAPTDGATSLSFWGPPRGFRDEGETAEEAARREAGEEAGTDAVIKVWSLGDFITNETTTASWSPFIAQEVDLDKLREIAPDRGEKIFKAQFFFPEEVEEMIKKGTYDGASTRSMVLITTFLLFRLMILPHYDP
jgi:8-oxo-dGTP pyrophosphatase MutT (NUDIX family)